MKTAVFTFGRMNPPTIGHGKLVAKMQAEATKVGGTALIYLSHSQDAKTNPIPYARKIKYAREAFGRIVINSQAKIVIDVLKEIDKKYDNVVMVVGSDRVQEFSTMIKKYNGKEWNFDSPKVASAGGRDPDAEGAAGMSASKMRAAAVAGEYDKFKSGVARGINAKRLYNDVRSGMGITEEKELEFTEDELDKFIALDLDWDELDEEDDFEPLEEVLTIQQRIKRGRMMRRLAPKMKRLRKMRKFRMAPKDRLQYRAQKAARQLIRKRVAGERGAHYHKLSISQKMMIDKMVDKKKGQMARIAVRMLPKVRKGELERLKRVRGAQNVKNDVDHDFDSYLINEEIECLMDEMNYKVDMEGFPVFFMQGDTPGEIRKKVRDLVKPATFKSVAIKRVPDAEVRKTFRLRATGKEPMVEPDDDVNEQTIIKKVPTYNYIGGKKKQAGTATSFMIRGKKTEITLHPQQYSMIQKVSKAPKNRVSELQTKDMSGQTVYIGKDNDDQVYVRVGRIKMSIAQKQLKTIRERSSISPRDNYKIEEFDLPPIRTSYLSAAKLPSHLAKFFDKDGNLKKDAADRIAKGRVKFNIKDVTPKGYGPKEDVEFDEATKPNMKDPADDMTRSILSDMWKDWTGSRPRNDSFWAKNKTYGQIYKTMKDLEKLIQADIDRAKDDRKRRKLEKAKEKTVQALRSFGKPIPKGHAMKQAFKKAGWREWVEVQEGDMKADKEAGIKWVDNPDWKKLHDIDNMMIIDYLDHLKIKDADGTPLSLTKDGGVAEGRMKELHMLIKQGKTADQIAKILKIDPKAVKALMDHVEIDELSKKTLGSYVSKASDSRGHKKLSTKKVDKRYAGVSKASKKLSKEEVEIDEVRQIVFDYDAAAENRFGKRKATYTYFPVDQAFEDMNEDWETSFKPDAIVLDYSVYNIPEWGRRAIEEARRGRPSKKETEERENFLMQLRKVISMRGLKPLTFKDGKKLKISDRDAHKMISIFGRQRTSIDKGKFQAWASSSPAAFKDALKGKKIPANKDFLGRDKEYLEDPEKSEFDEAGGRIERRADKKRIKVMGPDGKMRWQDQRKEIDVEKQAEEVEEVALARSNVPQTIKDRQRREKARAAASLRIKHQGQRNTARTMSIRKKNDQIRKKNTAQSQQVGGRPKSMVVTTNIAASDDSLQVKADKHGLAYNAIKEVFKRGADANKNPNLTPEQNGFNRVNSYINGGKARELDDDINSFFQEEHGAGEFGTDKLRKKYSKDTPGQTEDITLAFDYVKKPDIAPTAREILKQEKKNG